jgi:hypothetical protein
MPYVGAHKHLEHLTSDDNFHFLVEMGSIPMFKTNHLKLLIILQKTGIILEFSG